MDKFQQNLYETGKLHLAFLREAKKDVTLGSSIYGDDMMRILADLIEGAAKILIFIEQQPEKISVARKFIEYYMDKTVLLIEKYKMFLDEDLAKDEEIPKKVIETLDSFTEVYSYYYSKLHEVDVMDLISELKVIDKNLKEDQIEVKSGDIERREGIDVPTGGISDEELDKFLSGTSHGVSYSNPNKEKSTIEIFKDYKPLTREEKDEIRKRVISHHFFHGLYGKHYIVNDAWSFLLWHYALFITGVPILTLLFDCHRIWLMTDTEFDEIYGYQDGITEA